MLKMKKFKLLITTMTMMLLIMAPAAHVYAAEISDKIIEVQQNEGSGHQNVIAFGKSIAIIYPDGRMEIIANNPSGRIDVMINGKVTKGIGTVIVSAQNRTNIILEENSFVVSNVNEKQADELKKIILKNLSDDKSVESLTVIESQESLQNINAFTIGKKGELQNSEGTVVPASVLTGVQVKTPEVVYEEFVEEMQESIQREQKLQEESKISVSTEDNEENDNDNAITGACNHEWVLSDIDYLFMNGFEGCVTAPIYECSKCGIVTWYDEQQYHAHGEDYYCEYCGCNAHGYKNDSEEIKCSDGAEHNFVEKNIPTESESPIIDGSYEFCITGTVKECTKCNLIDTTSGEKHQHGTDFCTYCGFNSEGKTAETTVE